MTNKNNIRNKYLAQASANCNEQRSLKVTLIAEHFGVKTNTVYGWVKKGKLNRRKGVTPMVILLDDKFYAMCQAKNKPYESSLDKPQAKEAEESKVDEVIADLHTKLICQDSFRVEVDAHQAELELEQKDAKIERLQSNLGDDIDRVSSVGIELSVIQMEIEKREGTMDLQAIVDEQKNVIAEQNESLQEFETLSLGVDNVIGLQKEISELRVQLANERKAKIAVEVENTGLKKRIGSAHKHFARKEEQILRLQEMLRRQPTTIQHITKPQRDVVKPSVLPDEFAVSCIRAGIDINGQLAQVCREKNWMPHILSHEQLAEIMNFLLPRNVYSANAIHVRLRT